MITFENDYSCGAHPAVLQRLLETNLVPQPGYGADAYSENARQKIRAACACPDAEVFFLSGGTQTNAVVLASILQPWEGVIAAQTGHIHVHEAGAPEALGAKSTSPTPRNGAPSTPKQSCRQFPRSARNSICGSIWTAPGWPTV